LIRKTPNTRFNPNLDVGAGSELLAAHESWAQTHESWVTILFRGESENEYSMIETLVKLIMMYWWLPILFLAIVRLY